MRLLMMSTKNISEWILFMKVGIVHEPVTGRFEEFSKLNCYRNSKSISVVNVLIGTHSLSF